MVSKIVVPIDVTNFDDEKVFIFRDTPPCGHPSSQRGIWIAPKRKQNSPLARGVRRGTPGGVAYLVIEIGNIYNPGESWDLSRVTEKWDTTKSTRYRLKSPTKNRHPNGWRFFVYSDD